MNDAVAVPVVADASIATVLARRIADTAFADLTADALYWAKVAVLDTVGCTLAGANEDCARIALQASSYGASGGDCSVFGTRHRTTPLNAAMANGTAAHALDYDDCSDTLGGHPSAPVLPALFALAEMEGSSGRDFLTAYVAGWEAETRIASGVNFHHYEKGWHPTATMGVFGAAAASARLLGLDADRTATALALAATFASGIKANFGTMTKPLHVGHAARNGLYAALLARDGFTANHDAFEHKQGFLHVFNGAGNFNAERIVAEWARPWDIVSPGVAIKQYPCCGSTHPAIDAMLMLVRDHKLTPDRVERIESWTHPRRLAHTNRPDPRGELDAKFSVQYCLARAMVSGRVGIEHFEGTSYLEPEVQSVLRRVTSAAQADRDWKPSEHFGADVKVTLRDGKVLEQHVPRPLGRGPTMPLSDELLEVKFANCAGRTLHANAIPALARGLRDLENVAAVRDLTEAMAGAVK